MTLDEIQAALLSAASTFWEWVGWLFSSSFSIAFIGALGGAYAGAVAAQRSIEKSKEREELLSDVRSAHAGMMLAFTVCNTALGLKKQLVAPMLEKFRTGRDAFRSFVAEARSVQMPRPQTYEFQADLVTFMVPFFPVEGLRDLVFSHLATQLKAINLVSQLDGAVTGLSGAIAARGELIDRFRNQSPSPSQWPYVYFGERLPSGHTHGEYADVLHVIESYTNDVIWFSEQLCSELAKCGGAKNQQYRKRFGKDAQVVDEPDFSGPKQAGLFPPDADYSSWSNWIVEKKQGEASGAKRA